jgi:hypothetical protein
MKYSLVLFSSIISPTPIPKLCIHCKHYTKNILKNSEFGKCLLFLREKENDKYLVPGKKINKSDYYYCSVARKYNHLCGEKGKMYEQK